MNNNNNTKKAVKAVLVDIDGTLVTVTPNWSLARTSEWNTETVQAEGLEGGIAMLRAFHMMGYKLVFLTSRGQSCKVYTWMKLRELRIDHMVDSMWHRPAKWDGIAPHEYKAMMITQLAKRFNIVWAMEDEDKNIDVMRALGIHVIDAKVWH